MFAVVTVIALVLLTASCSPASDKVALLLSTPNKYFSALPTQSLFLVAPEPLHGSPYLNTAGVPSTPTPHARRPSSISALSLAAACSMGNHPISYIMVS